MCISGLYYLEPITYFCSKNGIYECRGENVHAIEFPGNEEFSKSEFVDISTKNHKLLFVLDSSNDCIWCIIPRFGAYKLKPNDDSMEEFQLNNPFGMCLKISEDDSTVLIVSDSGNSRILLFEVKYLNGEYRICHQAILLDNLDHHPIKVACKNHQLFTSSQVRT